MPIRPPSHLSDAPLTEALDAVVASGRTSDAVVLAHLAEFDARKLYLEIGHDSMFRYCVDHLRMSEDVACKRVWVARVARKWPRVFDAIESGRLNLSGVYLLAKHLTRANGAELLRAAAGRTREQIRELLAVRGLLKGAAGLPVTAGPVPTPAPGAPAGVPGLATPAAGEPVPPASVTTASGQHAPGHVEGISPNEIAVISQPPARRAKLTPVAPGRFELVAILGQEAYEQLVASRELLGHAVPAGDLAEVLERAIALQFTHLRKRRCGAAARPRSGTAKDAGATSQQGAWRQPGAARQQPVARRPANPRHIPAAVRREVWERDGGCCTFVGAKGHVCGSRERLELDHVVPVVHGGQATASNLRLLCRAHNQHVARRVLGELAVQARREAAQRQRAVDRAHKQAERERIAARKAELERQREELGVALRTLGYRGDELRLALTHCAARAAAPPEERLRYALGRMAPNARREGPVAITPASP